MPTNESGIAYGFNGTNADTAANAAARSQQDLINMTGPNWSNYAVAGRRYKINDDSIVRDFFSGVAGVCRDDAPALVNMGCARA